MGQYHELADDLAELAAQRHPSVASILNYFSYKHLPNEYLQSYSKIFCDLAKNLLENLPDSPELTAGLRKLLEAKDCVVRCAVDEAKRKGI